MKKHLAVREVLNEIAINEIKCAWSAMVLVNYRILIRTVDRKVKNVLTINAPLNLSAPLVPFGAQKSLNSWAQSLS